MNSDKVATSANSVNRKAKIEAAVVAKQFLHLTKTIPVKAPKTMDDEEIAGFVAEGAARVAVFCEQLKPYYLDLRDRFSEKKSKSATIYDCRTWDDYCTKVLDRTKRAVNYFLAGGNPASKVGGRRFAPSSRQVQDLEMAVRAGARYAGRQAKVMQEIADASAAGQVGNDFPPNPSGIFVKDANGRDVAMMTVETEAQPEPETGVGLCLHWLRNVLLVFEKLNYGEVEVAEMRERLTSAEIQILLNCKDWMQRILSAKAKATQEGRKS